MRGLIMLQIDGVDKKFIDDIAIFVSSQQHVHLIFKPFAWNLTQPVQHMSWKSTKSGLRIMDLDASREGVYHSRECVPKAATQGNYTAELPTSEDEMTSRIV